MSTSGEAPPHVPRVRPDATLLRWLRRCLRTSLLLCLVGWLALDWFVERPSSDAGDAMLLTISLAPTESFGRPKVFLGPPGVVPVPDIAAVAAMAAPPPMEMRARHLRIEVQGGVPATSLYELFGAVKSIFPRSAVPNHELTLLPE